MPRLSSISITIRDSGYVNPFPDLCGPTLLYPVGCIPPSQLPRHLQIAWGRRVFQYMHGEDSENTRRRTTIWMRDFPLAVVEYPAGLEAYRAECLAHGINPDHIP